MMENILFFREKMFNFYKLFFILVFLFLQGCGGCETAEDLGTEEKRIEVPATYSSDLSLSSGPKDKTTLWKSSEVFVNAGGIGGTEDINFNVISNDVNLCPDSKDVFIDSTQISQYLYTGIDVKAGDFLKISLIKKAITIDCEASQPGIVITDKEKCLNGYYKQDGSNAFVPPAHKQTAELEYFVAIPSDAERPGAIANGYKDYLHNAFISVKMMNKPEHQRLLSKVLLVPEEYESVEKDVYSYSPFPPIPGDEKNPATDLGFLTQQIGSSSDPKKIQEVTKKYWCREYGRNPGPNSNINGNLLMRLCDEFYYMDKDKDKNNLKPDNETLMDYEAWEKAPLNSKNMGNTMRDLHKITSVIENKSYRKVNVGTIDFSGMDLPSGVKPDQLNDVAGGEQYISIVHSKVFAVFDGAIGNSTPTNIDSSGNLNSDFIDCSQTSYVARCWGGPLIPLDYDVETKKDGKFFVKFGKSNIKPGGEDQYIGNLNINVQKSCKLKNLVAYVLPMSGSANLDILPTTNSSNFIKIPMMNSDGSQVEEFTIKGSDIKNDGFIYFAVEDNGDGYENNTGIVKLKTRVPKNFKDNALKFFKNLSDMIMNIIFGKQDPKTGLRSGGVANLLFDNMIKSERFQSIIRVASVLTIVIYGISVVIGAVQISASELIKKAFKLGTVFVLLQPYAWEFFNKFLFSAIIDGARDLAAFTTAPPPRPGVPENMSQIVGGNERYIFGPLADMVERLLDFTIWKQILALIFAGPFGYIFFLFLKMTLLSLLEGTFMVFLTYASSMFIIGLLISVAPLFIITLLFQTTSHIFKEWAKVLLSNMLTIMLVFTGINMISGIIGSLINQVFGFGVCTSCAVIYDLTDNFPICLMHASLPDGYDVTADILDLDGNRFMEKATNTGRFFNIPIPFGGFVALCIMCPLVKTFHEFCTNMASELTGVDFGSPIGRQNVASAIGDSMKWWVGKDDEGKRQTQNAAVQKRSDVSGVKVKDE
jgi:type IV secretory pathway VirB6-like protein